MSKVENIHFYIWKRRFQKFTDNPKALLPFLKKKLYYNFVADNYLKHYADFKYLNYKETLDYVVDNEKSIIRFGDDIFDLIQGIGIYFGDWHQKYHPELAKRSEEILRYQNDQILLCFNPDFILKTKKEFKGEGIPEQYNFWTYSKIFLKNYYRKGTVYGQALTFHPRYNPDIDYTKLLGFFAKKHIIIITSGIERFQNISLGITTDFIEAPKNDAWDSYELIKEKIITCSEALETDSKKILVMVAMGSAAKVLVYDLTKNGYIVWDTGQFFDLAFKEIKKIASLTSE